jgi:hypothetical protein
MQLDLVPLLHWFVKFGDLSLDLGKFKLLHFFLLHAAIQHFLDASDSFGRRLFISAGLLYWYSSHALDHPIIPCSFLQFNLNLRLWESERVPCHAVLFLFWLLNFFIIVFFFILIFMILRSGCLVFFIRD